MTPALKWEACFKCWIHEEKRICWTTEVLDSHQTLASVQDSTIWVDHWLISPIINLSQYIWILSDINTCMVLSSLNSDGHNRQKSLTNEIFWVAKLFLGKLPLAFPRKCMWISSKVFNQKKKTLHIGIVSYKVFMAKLTTSNQYFPQPFVLNFPASKAGTKPYLLMYFFGQTGYSRRQETRLTDV